jgi:hypothetical protein
MRGAGRFALGVALGAACGAGAVLGATWLSSRPPRHPQPIVNQDIVDLPPVETGLPRTPSPFEPTPVLQVPDLRSGPAAIRTEIVEAVPSPPGWLAMPHALVGSDGWDEAQGRLACRGGPAMLSLHLAEAAGDCRIRLDATMRETDCVSLIMDARIHPGYENQQFTGLQCKFGGSGGRHPASLKSKRLGYIGEGQVVDLDGRHELIAERIGSRLRMLVDRREVLAVDLPPGPHGEDTAVGVGLWDGDITIHAVTAWTALSGSARIPTPAAEAPPAPVPPDQAKPGAGADFF